MKTETTLRLAWAGRRPKARGIAFALLFTTGWASAPIRADNPTGGAPQVRAASISDYFWLDSEAARAVQGIDLAAVAARVRNSAVVTNLGPIRFAVGLDQSEYRTGEPIHLFAFLQATTNQSVFVPKAQNWEMLRVAWLRNTASGKTLEPSSVGQWVAVKEVVAFGGRYLVSPRSLHVDVAELYDLAPGEYELGVRVAGLTSQAGGAPIAVAAPAAGAGTSPLTVRFRVRSESFSRPPTAPLSLLSQMYQQARQPAGTQRVPPKAAKP